AAALRLHERYLRHVAGAALQVAAFDPDLLLLDVGLARTGECRCPGRDGQRGRKAGRAEAENRLSGRDEGLHGALMPGPRRLMARDDLRDGELARAADLDAGGERVLVAPPPV